MQGGKGSTLEVVLFAERFLDETLGLDDTGFSTIAISISSSSSNDWPLISSGSDGFCIPWSMFFTSPANPELEAMYGSNLREISFAV